jgi:hypothetical protein
MRVLCVLDMCVVCVSRSADCRKTLQIYGGLGAVIQMPCKKIR